MERFWYCRSISSFATPAQRRAMSQTRDRLAVKKANRDVEAAVDELHRLSHGAGCRPQEWREFAAVLVQLDTELEFYGHNKPGSPFAAQWRAGAAKERLMAVLRGVIGSVSSMAAGEATREAADAAWAAMKHMAGGLASSVEDLSFSYITQVGI